MRAAFIAVEAGEHLLVDDLGGTVTPLAGVRFLVNCRWKLHQVNFGAKKISIAANKEIWRNSFQRRDSWSKAECVPFI